MSSGQLSVAIVAAWLLCVSGCGRSGGPGTGDDASVPAVPARTGLPERTGNGGDGVFRGRVLLDGPVPDRQKLMVVKDVAVCGKINHLDDRLVVGEGGGIRYAVVSVTGVPKGNGVRASAGGELTLDQRSCAYSPHVLLLPVGAKLKVLNSDGVLHNIHTFSTVNRPFNIAQPKVVRELVTSFDKPERIPVRCDVHGWMSSWLVVVDHPYHAVTDEEGRFEISGIPPGQYAVGCWQEELGEQTAVITIGASDGRAGNVSHDFIYSNVPPQARAN